MTVQTAAGATLHVSASTPVTFNVAGYDDIFGSTGNPTLVGEITDFGEFGRQYNLVTHNPVSTRGTRKFKGSYNEGTMDLQIGVDNDDAGQVIMKAAALSDDDYSFCVTLQNGDRFFFQAKVMSWRMAVGSVDSIVSATCSLELTTSSEATGGVGIVEDLA